ncbi:MAG: flavodoxin [Oliverpabstia sp.]
MKSSWNVYKQHNIKLKEMVIMTKKVVSILMVVLLIISLTACGQTTTNRSDEANSTSNESVQTNTEADTETQAVPSEPQSTEESTETVEMPHENGKTLIAYFSWSGNTQEMASYIQEQTKGDLFEIEPLNPYPTDYEECGDVALVERDENARPEIANLPDSIEEYDTIFIGYPIWWHTAPMIIGTFLENYDLSGVEVYPFTQSASMDTEQFENSMEFILESAAGANVHDGLFTEASDRSGILDYLTENGFVE